MNAITRIKLGLALILVAVAGLLTVRFWLHARESSDSVYFYDLSEKAIFKGPRTAVPPIRGINDAVEDGVRATVISTNGNPTDPSSRTVAYLEKYSPELKAQLELAQKTGLPPQLSRAQAQAHHFVKRLQDPEWFPLDSAEGERIVSEWANPGDKGITPVVCTP